MLGHMVFNGRDFGELFFCHAPKVLPSFSVNQTEVAGMDGAYFKSRRMLPVDIPCTMVLLGPKPDAEGMAALMHDVAADLLVPEQAELVLPSHENRYYIASVKDVSSVDEFVTSARINVVFHACDPVMYGPTRTLDLAASTTSTIRTGCNVPVRPVARASAVSGATYYRVRNVSAGEQVYVYPNKVDTSSSWSGGEAIEVDMGKQLATVNGQPWPVSLSSDYFEVSDGDGVWSNMATSLEWRERWL